MISWGTPWCITTTVHDYFGWTCGHLQQHPPGSLRRRFLMLSFEDPEDKPIYVLHCQRFWRSFGWFAPRYGFVPSWIMPTTCKQFLRIACFSVFCASFFIAIATFKQLFGFYCTLHRTHPLATPSHLRSNIHCLLVFCTLEDRWRPLSLPEVLHFWNRVQLVGHRQHALSLLQLHRPYGISFFW